MSRRRFSSFVKSLTLFAWGWVLVISGGTSEAAPPVVVPYEKCDAKNSYLEPSLLFNPLLNTLNDLKNQTLAAKANEMNCVFCTGPFSPFTSFESLTRNLPVKKGDPLAPPTIEDLFCVATIQSTFKGGGSYAKCSAPGVLAEKLPGSRSPCVSPTYVELTARAFNLVSACTRLDRREMMGLFAQESGFHLNALSYTNAGGIGQLTAVAIRGVQEIDKSLVLSATVKNVVTSVQKAIQDDPKCSPLKSVNSIELTEKQAKMRCEILSFPRNPLYPMLLSMKAYLYTKTRIEDQMDLTPALAKFTGADRKLIATDLSYYAYNGGYGGVWGSFATFLKTQAAKGVKKADVLMARFKNHLAAHYPHGGKSKREEISKHVYGDKSTTGIRGRMSVIDEKAGFSCFE